MTNRFEPRRLRDSADLGPLLAEAARVEVPAGAKERILARLLASHAPLAESAADPELASLLALARVEPPEGAQERIWKRLEEEALARAGLAEPRRLADSDDLVSGLLAEARELEPPVGRKARVLLRVPRRENRPLLGWALGGLGTAAAVAAVAFLVLHHPAPVEAPRPLAVNAPAPVQVVHDDESRTSGREAMDIGDALAVGTEAPQRLQVKGVGDLFLAGQGARLSLEKSDGSGVRLALAHGRIAVHAEKRRPNAPLVVAANGVEVKIVGTIFSVDATGPNVLVSVHEGLVEVRRGSEVSRVGAGQAWSAEDGVTRTMAPAAWAQDLMRTLAGEPNRLERTPPAPVRRERPEPKLPVIHESALPGTTPAPAATPVPPAPEAAPAAPAELAEVPTQDAHIDLKACSAGLLGRPVKALRQVVHEARERADFQREAGALYAAAWAPDGTAEDVTANLAALAHLLDEELADPEEARAVWRHLASQSPSSRPEALFNLLELSAEMDRDDVESAAAECLRGCAEDQRGIARWTLALAEQDTPKYEVALRLARANAHDAQKAAVHTYESRARTLRSTQLERARTAAHFAVILDPKGVSADVRALANE